MRRSILGLMLVCGGAFAARADDAPLPPIRSFDLAMIEKLGRQIYDQDQEAWKGTDILDAAHPTDELKAKKLHGWIVVPSVGGDIVRFIHDGADGPEHFYDVTFPSNGAPALSEPQDRALSAEERAQYDARALALKNIDIGCADTFNTVALKDPERGGWLVWVMSATAKDPDLIIVGGTRRVTVSADGKTILQTDKLSKGCMNFDRKETDKAQQGDIYMNQIVSDLPVESFVFASLSYRRPFRIGTPDGKFWKINADMITNIDMDMPDPDGFAARMIASFDENCYAFSKKGDDDKDIAKAQLKSVIAATEQSERYVPEIKAEGKIVSVACGRDGLYLAPNDYKVLFAGIPLMVVARGSNGSSRAGSLYVQDGQFRFEMMDGDHMSDDETRAVGKRLDQFQAKPWPKD